MYFDQILWYKKYFIQLLSNWEDRRTRKSERIRKRVRQGATRYIKKFLHYTFQRNSSLYISKNLGENL